MSANFTVLLCSSLVLSAGVVRAAETPGSTAPTTTAPTTPAKLAKPTERRLHPTDVDASSFLWNDWNKFQENYHPSYVVDGDLKTAWVEGVQGTGAGEWIRLKVTPLADTTKVRLVVNNGYQKSADLFRANARAKDVVIKLIPSGVEVTRTLAAKMGREEVTIEQSSGLLEAIEVKIVSVTEGRKYEDTCLSDIAVFVTSLTPENPAFEKSHLDRLVSWKKERKAAAALFSKTQKEKLPVGRRYSATVTPKSVRPGFDVGNVQMMLSSVNSATESMTRGHAASIKLARELLAQPDTLRPVDVVAKDKRPIPPVDGLCSFGLQSDWCGEEGLLLPGTLGLLNTNGFGVFETKAAINLEDALAATAPACQREALTTVAWAKFAEATTADGPPRTAAVILVECQLTCSRSGLSPEAVGQLLVYDDAGRLDLIVTEHRTTAIEWGDDGVLASAEIRSPFSSTVVGLVSAVAER